MFNLESHEKHPPMLNLDKEILEFADNFAEKNNISKNNLVIGLHTGSAGRWQDKKLSIVKTVELIDKIKNKFENAKILLFGGPEESERNEKIN